MRTLAAENKLSGDNQEARNMAIDFQVGQAVHCLIHGDGTVLDIIPGKMVPIFVHFEKGGICMYTAEGQVSISASRTLFPKGGFQVEALPGADLDAPFYAGQEVICLAHGTGKVVHVFEEKAAAFPVQVEFDQKERGVCSYSLTGKMSISAVRTLYAKGSVKIKQ